MIQVKVVMVSQELDPGEGATVMNAWLSLVRELLVNYFMKIVSSP